MRLNDIIMLLKPNVNKHFKYYCIQFNYMDFYKSKTSSSTRENPKYLKIKYLGFSLCFCWLQIDYQHYL